MYWEAEAPPDFAAFDALIIHYSLAITYDSHVPASVRAGIKRFPGLKIQFIQDEYRWIDDVVAAMRDLGVHVLYTISPGSTAESIYAPLLRDGLRLQSTLAGYVSQRLTSRSVPRVAERPLHVVYRGREIPFWLGRLAYEKREIGERFRAAAPGLGLKVDISSKESDRVYAREWERFLCSGKASLGSGGGVSIVDFDGSVEADTRDYLRQHPEADFETVHAAVLAPHEGNAAMEVVSPRIFEAVALRAALVLYPGPYSGVLERWRHYIPLERDFSNIDEVADRLRDDDWMQQLVDRAFEEIAQNPAYSAEAFVAGLDELIDEELQPGSGRPTAPGPDEATARAGGSFRRLRASVWRWRPAVVRLRWRWRRSRFPQLGAEIAWRLQRPFLRIRSAAQTTLLWIAVALSTCATGRARRVMASALFRWREVPLAARLRACLHTARLSAAFRFSASSAAGERLKLSARRIDDHAELRLSPGASEAGTDASRLGSLLAGCATVTLQLPEGSSGWPRLLSGANVFDVSVLGVFAARFPDAVAELGRGHRFVIEDQSPAPR